MEIDSRRINFLGFEVEEEEGPPNIDEEHETVVFEERKIQGLQRAEPEHQEFSAEFV